MIVKRIEGANHTFVAEGCMDLPVRVAQYEGQQVFESAWEPTPDELAQLNAGASITLAVLGMQPPVLVYVAVPTEEHLPYDTP